MKKYEFEFLVKSAIKAPSAHNTQPWKFEKIKKGIIIYPDFERILSIVDKDNYELYISLGCALENLLIAARQLGYIFEVKYPKEMGVGIHLELLDEKIDIVLSNLLFNQISKRQVTKTKYSNKSIPDDILKKITLVSDFDSISLTVLDGIKNFRNIIPLIIEANNLQFNNKDFLLELVKWIRFSKKDAEKKGDGIWSATMGKPEVGRFIGSFIIKKIVTSKSEERQLKNLLDHTQGMIIFSSKNNTAEDWVKTGQIFQRFGLITNYFGISHSHINMPCEEIEIRKKLAKKLGIEDRHPLLLIRYGYANKMPYSYRRSFEEVII